MTERTIKLHPKQWEAFNFTKQFGAAICGVQAGKTTVLLVWVQKKINEFPSKNGLIAAPTYKILQQSTLEKFFGLFPEYRAYYKQQQGVIELPTGGRVFIRSADEPLGLEGMTLHWAALDEAGMMNRLVWSVIRSRVSATGGQVFIVSTPYNLGWLYQDFYLPWKDKKDDDLEVFTWKSIDNPYFPKDFYEKEKQRLSPQEFARRYEGIFQRMSGLVYELQDYQILKDTEENHKKHANPEVVIAGIDWGFVNPAAMPILVVKDGTFYLTDELYETQKTTAEIIEKAKMLRDKWRINYFYPDPAEPDRVEECKRAGLYVKETNKDIKSGISKVQQLIRENRFYVFENCKNAIDEFNSYHYDEEKTKDEPVKENDHLMDAIRYAIVGYLPHEKTDLVKIKVEMMKNRRNYQTINTFE